MKKTKESLFITLFGRGGSFVTDVMPRLLNEAQLRDRSQIRFHWQLFDVSKIHTNWSKINCRDKSRVLFSQKTGTTVNVFETFKQVPRSEPPFSFLSNYFPYANLFPLLEIISFFQNNFIRKCYQIY